MRDAGLWRSGRSTTASVIPDESRMGTRRTAREIGVGGRCRGVHRGGSLNSAVDEREIEARERGRSMVDGDVMAAA